MMPAVHALKSKITIAVVMIIAVVRVATAKPPDAGKPIKPELARQAYREITSRERSMRRDAAVKFPGDLWSQDDDLHERESEAVRAFATGHEVPISDVVRAIDDGMHEHWPTAGTPQATVPPCRPRLSY
jgi:hypothetical protein